MLGYQVKIFQLGTQLTVAAKNLGVIGIALTELDAPRHFPDDKFLGYGLREILTWFSMMALSTVASRHMWLSLTTIPKRDSVFSLEPLYRHRGVL